MLTDDRLPKRSLRIYFRGVARGSGLGWKAVNVRSVTTPATQKVADLCIYLLFLQQRYTQET